MIKLTGIDRSLLLILSQCGDILLDWRSSIGSTALVLLQIFFETNKLTTVEIVNYVEWAYAPEHRQFNFIYKDADAPAVSKQSIYAISANTFPQGSKGGLQSQLVLDMLVAHTKKTLLAGIEYGHPIGGMGLCVAAVRAHSSAPSPC